ncbi:HEAT repeat domain-containing protein [Salmonella enterica]|nr:HEAT repeat domain-containing protein [Salmonella enterica]EAM1440972.1 HEAT repeat domain-containing protein [Salmonella enterica]EAP6042613.1 HEAT repeat domain-containing protein [Salmonella enterica]
MSMPPAIANTFLFEMMKSKSKDDTLAAIYALGEGRCQAENITRELHRLSQSDVRCTGNSGHLHLFFF